MKKQGQALLFLLALAAGTRVYAQSTGNNPILIGLEQMSSLTTLLQGKKDFRYMIDDQSILDHLTQDLTNVANQKSLSAGMPLNVGNWNIQISADQTRLKYTQLWEQVSNDHYNHLTAPRLSMQIGIAKSTNLGVSYMQLSGIDLKYYGLELTQLVSTADSPVDLVARFNHTYTSSQGKVRLSTDTAELLLSHQWNNVRPYLGMGMIEGKSHVDFREFSNLSFSRQHSQKYFAGVEVFYSKIRLALEAGLINQQPYQGTKLSFNF